MRITIVTNNPTPYRAPLYTRIDNILRDRGGRLTVVYGAQTEPRNQWGEATVPLGAQESIFVGRPLVVRGRATYIDPRVVGALGRSHPDVVVAGGYAPWIYLVAAWARLNRIPFLIWSAETIDTARVTGARTLRRRPLWRAATMCLAYGPAAAAYLREVGGLDPTRIVVLGNGIDVDAFTRRVDAARDRRMHLRTELDVSESAILSVGGKNLSLVTNALDLMKANATVLVVGAPAGRTPRDSRFRDLGRRPPYEMPAVYAAADVLVHTPQVDYWPHAVNEALAAGLPTVVSVTAGVPEDAVSGPGCALVVPRAEPVARALDEAVHASASSSPDVRKAIREPTRKWGVEAMAARFVDAAASVVA